MATIVDPRAEAMKYMEEKKVRVLFDILGTRLAKERPENPNEFLVQELKKIYTLRAANQPVTIFTKEEVATMFRTFDITGRGYVTIQQYQKALLAIGVNPSDAPTPAHDQIDQNTFVTLVFGEALKKAF